MLRVKVFNTVCRYFLRNRFRCVGVTFRKESMSLNRLHTLQSHVSTDTEG